METTDRFVIDVRPEFASVIDLMTDKAVGTFVSPARLLLAEESAANLNRKHELGIDPAIFLRETLPAFAARQRAEVLTSLAEIEALTAKIRRTLDSPTTEA